jgi:L-lactate utilization protein LutB
MSAAPTDPVPSRAGAEATADRPGSLREFIDRFARDTLERCTRCGRCYEACPMTPYEPRLAGARGGSVVEGLLPMLRGERGSEQALDWVRICTQSAACNDACPEGIHAMRMLRVARMSALGQLGAPAQMSAPEDPLFFRRIEAFAATQLDEAQIEEWHRADPATRGAR